MRKLYRDTGLDLDAELALINTTPRVEADAAALDFWGVHGRTVNGKPGVPVLRIHTLGDIAVPVNLVDGYDEAVRRNGRNALYRTAFVEATGHCTFSAAESVAAIETLMDRIDTGGWGSSAQPKKLNERARELDSSPARYVHHTLEKYAREWFPE